MSLEPRHLGLVGNSSICRILGEVALSILQRSKYLSLDESLSLVIRPRVILISLLVRRLVSEAACYDDRLLVGL